MLPTFRIGAGEAGQVRFLADLAWKEKGTQLFSCSSFMVASFEDDRVAVLGSARRVGLDKLLSSRPCREQSFLLICKHGATLPLVAQAPPPAVVQ